MQDQTSDSRVRLSDAETILDSITDAFFSLNSNWEFSYVNRQTVATLGCESKDLLGKSIWDVYPGTVGSDFERMYRKAAEERTSQTFNSYYPDHDRWYDVNVYPAPDGLSVYFRDVTARMREEERRTALVNLTDIFRDLSRPEEIMYRAAEILGQTLGASRVGYGTIDPVAETLHVVRDWNAPGVESLAGTLHLRHYGSFIDDLKAAKLVVVNDVDKDGRTADFATALKERSAASFVNVPVVEKGKLVAVIFVNGAQVKNWSAEELVFIREVAERTRIASERARNAAELDKVIAESERRRRLYEACLENTPDLAYVFGLDHRFIYANKVLLRMWGRTWDEAIGKTCLELGYEPWHADMHDREIDQVIASKRSIRGEVPFEGTNGRRIYEYIFTPVLGLDGQVEAVAGTTRDVTERKQTEERLLAADRRKDEFLAMLAHELRNPLAPIAAAAEVLQAPSLDDKLTKRTSRIIARQVKHMTALVNDLLDVSRVTRGLVRIEKSSLDLKSIIYSAVEQVRPFIEAQRHHLHFDLAAEKAYVMGDQKRLVQIITNLLNNAAKYTPQGGDLRLRLVVEANALALTIEDNGIGIPVELQSQVFELFTQAERTSDRAQGGLGIGLALVKSLTELHGGTISCFSEGRGKGSQFTVRLPRHHVAPDAAVNESGNLHPASRPKQPLRILVVDDNIDAAQMLALYLETLGHQVLISHSSTLAIVRATQEKPDVCILDIGLPEMDGNELVRRLKAEPETAHALFIAVTGYGQEHDRLKTMAAGFNHHLVKPVDVAKLANLLTQHRP
ncbi:PAS domain-containing protein [Massilia sp. TW-1]|uniref:histidine kinase n=1 Tax=Telluria antibiotica TaxID=2717319 RepID=A0ABX0P5L0_9BURK|nr:PAS domain-containing protein [Telluria antibiotica]NIA52522.1 PAS domain-containing protein [Telluria antibiotica]